MEDHDLAPLTTLWVTPDLGLNAVPDTEQLTNKPLLILLHGYGSNERDLAGLAPYLPSELNIVSLRAPLTMQPGSYTWFPIGQPGNPDPAVVDIPVQQLLAWIDEAILPHQPSSIGLLGFSMGGALTIQLMRYRPEQFSYGVNLSGFSVSGVAHPDAAPASINAPLFWGYDVADPVIVGAARRRTAEFLPTFFDVTERQYVALGHSVSREELADVSEFIQQHL